MTTNRLSPRLILDADFFTDSSDWTGLEFSGSVSGANWPCSQFELSGRIVDRKLCA